MALANEERFRSAKRWRDDVNPNLYAVHSCIGPMHYESVIDSGDFDTEYDFGLSRINNANLNGWRVTGSQFHFALQGFPETGAQPAQGTFAYGGRQGAHWLGLALERIGFLHWPTRVVTPVGGVANYVRSNLSMVQGVAPVGPIGGSRNISFRGEWTDLWSTPGGGRVDLEFRGSAVGLKQQVIFNQAAREYLQTQRPATPLNETYLIMRYLLDWRNPNTRVFKGETQQDRDSDLNDLDDGRFSIRDEQDRLLGIFPIDKGFVRNRGGRVRLRKRFYRDGGNNYLVVGAPLSELAALSDGDLVFDPAITQEEIDNENRDCHQANDGTVQLNGWSNLIYCGDYQATGNYSNLDVGIIFSSVPIPQGASLTGGGSEMAEIQLYKGINNGLTDALIYGIDEDDAANFSSSRGPKDVTLTTASTIWIVPTGNSQYVTTPDVGDEVEEIVGRATWAEDNNLGFAIMEDNPSGSDYTAFEDYSAGGNIALFDAFYTSDSNVTAAGTIAVSGALAADGTSREAGTAAVSATLAAVGRSLVTAQGTCAVSATLAGTATNLGAGTVSLSWTQVSNATHLAAGAINVAPILDGIGTGLGGTQFAAGTIAVAPTVAGNGTTVQTGSVNVSGALAAAGINATVTEAVGTIGISAQGAARGTSRGFAMIETQGAIMQAAGVSLVTGVGSADVSGTLVADSVQLARGTINLEWASQAGREVTKSKQASISMLATLATEQPAVTVFIPTPCVMTCNMELAAAGQMIIPSTEGVGTISIGATLFAYPSYISHVHAKGSINMSISSGSAGELGPLKLARARIE